MPRLPRLQFDGAVYHLTSRGDHGEAIFRDDADRQRLLDVLADACVKTGWLVHAYVLMPNHYHILLETPRANLVDGMRWLQGTYTIRYNRRHKLHGHLFQGRYKSLLIDPDEDDFFPLVSTYIHLNPVRAGLAPAERRGMERFRWSSLPAYLGPRSRRPDWLCVDRVLAALDLSDSPAGRESYGSQVVDQARRLAGAEGVELQRQWKAIRRGWRLGGDAFRKRVEMLLKGVLEGHRAGSYVGPGVREYHQHSAEELLAAGLKAVGLAPDQLPLLRKTDPRKQAVAWLLRKHTTVRNAWLSEALSMGHEVNVSQSVGRIDRAATDELARWKAAVAKVIS